MCEFIDEAKKKKITIDLEELSNILKVPVVGVTARKKKTLNNLLKVTKSVCERKEEKHKIYQIQYQENIERAIKQVQEIIMKQYSIEEKLARWISIKVLDGEERILKEIEKQLHIKLINHIEVDNVKKEALETLEVEGMLSRRI